MTGPWHNWSGSVAARPARVVSPRSEDELAAVVRESDKVRVVGAGHSFMPLCATDGTLVQLGELEGRVELSADGRTAWAPGGWSLSRVAAALWELGRSLPNQGDIDVQSLAGAIATGTHGTGAELGSLSTFARAFRLMLATARSSRAARRTARSCSRRSGCPSASSVSLHGSSSTCCRRTGWSNGSRGCRSTRCASDSPRSPRSIATPSSSCSRMPMT
jgi:FAD/FMN-containing dehydrogenase